MSIPVEVIIKEGGGVVAIARALGIDHTSIIGWRKSGQIPATRVAAIERLTGIPSHKIRPDVFPAPAEAA